MRRDAGTTIQATATGRLTRPAAPTPLGAAESAEWAALVAERLGLYFSPERRQSLEERLWSRVQALALGSPALYRAYLLSHPKEWDVLADAIVVSESRFFREAGSFAALREQILPELVRRREQAGRPRELAIWSAGCSTGEEAYTLAMIALETVPLPSLWELRVLGTDLSERNIAQARAGVYDQRRLEALPTGWARRYAVPTPGEERAQMGTAVRLLTTFRQHNLCGDLWTIGPQDVIVCQNVLIYFRREEQIRVLNRLYDTLRPGGYLLVGATELPIVPIRPGVSPVRIGDALAYRRA